ncbi:ABC transporter permease [Candidatus Acetothermia bacterium]|nr:ABC transporter permease [Candidatus Acetothermia bacterium]
MLKIALRNVFRNRRRTTLSLFLIAIGTAALFIVEGYIDAGYVRLKELSAATYGHLQIAHERYWRGDLTGYRYLITPEELKQIGQTLSSAQPDLDSYTETLAMEGLIGNNQRNTTFIGIGVEPENQIIGFSVQEGRGLQKGDLAKVFIGEQMAQMLNVKVGDPLVVMAQTVEGSVNTGRLEIVGFFKGPQPEQDAHLAFLPLAFVQKLLNTEGVEKVIIKLRSMEATDRVGEQLKRAIVDSKSDFIVKTWSDLSTFYHQVRAFWNVMFGFMNAAIFTLVFFSILEVMTMSFFERMREIGTVRALGTKRWQVFTIFFAESVCLGLVGAVLGLGLGVVGGWIINGAKILYSPPGFSLTVAVEIWLAPSTCVVPFITTFISTLISTIFPALRAARTNIVEALRHV